jgi:phage gp45-like
MKKLMIVTLIAAAGLTVAACKKAEAPVVDANATVVDETAMNGVVANDTMGNVTATASNAVAATNAVVAPVAAATNAVAK